MSALSRFAEENGGLTIHEARAAWDAVEKERERIAKLIAEFDDFVYHEPEWAGRASVIDGGPSMERLAGLIRGGA